VEFRDTRLQGVRQIVPRVFRDTRGHFFESFREDEFHAAGITHPFVQDNHSRSTRGTVRALHFQTQPGQPKLVRVARGRVFDVTVDLRRDSPTFGRWQGIELDDEEGHLLYIPVGFAHGFCALSEVADFVYKVGSYYDPATERGLLWNDPDLGVDWPVDAPILSERDAANPTLAELRGSLPRWPYPS
jgi:dTDP-4-dehydrorhamnose 3,5-epimerase